jgi:exosortase
VNPNSGALTSVFGTSRLPSRFVAFSLLLTLTLVLLHVPVMNLLKLALQDQRYSHILLIPFIGIYLIWSTRAQIFGVSGDRLPLGVPLLLVGLGLVSLMGNLVSFSGPDGRFAVTILGGAVVLAAEFVLCFGRRALRAAIFPFMFLLLMVPIPSNGMDWVVFELQRGSAEMSYGLFKLVGMPVFREGFRFSLPGVDIEVAAECSGIRSSLSLLITSILVGHTLLRSSWSQTVFALITIPVVIFKNAVRIVTISWLGVYVDRGFLYGDLHQYGGLAFSFLGLAILFVVFLALQKSETTLART